MPRKLLFLYSFVIVCFSPMVAEGIKPSIVGGQESDPGAYPWVVALIRNDADSIEEGQFCGGTLIHPQWVLTAAHCVSDYSADIFEIVVNDGDLNGEVYFYEPAAIFIHPEWHLKRLMRGCDLALIRLKTPIENVTPVSIQRAVSILIPGRETKTLGWGQTENDTEEDTTSSILKEIDSVLVEIDEFSDSHPIHDYYIKTSNSEPIGGIGAGDSGGPILVRNEDNGDWVVAGVNSFVFFTGDDEPYPSFYTSVPVASDWIDSMIEPKYSEKPAVSSIDRFVFEIEGEGTIGYKIWPFANDLIESLTPLNDARFGDPIVFFMEGPDFYDPRYTYHYNGDGSFTFIPKLNRINSGNERTFISEVSTIDTRSYGNALIPICPFGRYTGKQVVSPLSYERKHAIFRLEGLEPGIEYTLASLQNSSSFSFYETSRRGLVHLKATTYSDPDEYSFTAQADREYWVQLYAGSEFGETYTLSFLPSERTYLGDTEVADAVLDGNSHHFRGDQSRVALIEYEGFGDHELQLSVYSEFDSEITLIDKSTNAIVGYLDVESEDATEIFIASADDLRRSVVAVHNFDKGAYGALSVSVTEHTDFPLEFDVSQRRSITHFDNSNYNNTLGRPVYYEELSIEGHSVGNYINISVDGKEFDPLVVVFQDGELLDFVYDGERIDFEFISESDSEYIINVLDFESPQNANFDILVTESERPITSNIESDSMFFSKKSADRIILPGIRSNLNREVLARFIKETFDAHPF